MICGRPTCGGKLRIYETLEIPLPNLRHHRAVCQKCGKKWLLETKIRREVRRSKKAKP